MSHLIQTSDHKLLNITSNTTFVVPAGYSILQILINNTSANAITGGLKIGTTSGAVDVISALVVGATSIQRVPDSLILKGVFSTSANTTLHIQAVTLWNSASINIHFVLRKFT